MSDRDPDLTPEQEARLRRLLVDARHGDPIPVDVAARLDRVLDQLAAEGPDTIEPSLEVDDLVARRRRRVTGLLVAAAAVVVVGVGLGQAVRTDSSDDMGAVASSVRDKAQEESSAGTSGDAPIDAAGAQDVQSDTAQAPPAVAGPSAETDGALVPRQPVVLTKGRFALQVVRYRNVAGYRAGPGDDVGAEAFTATASFVCDPADWGAGRLVAASYDGIPTVLAYRPPAGSTQTVELLRCGTAEVLRSTVLASQ